MKGHVRKRGAGYVYVVDVGLSATGKRKQRWVSGFRTKADAQAALNKTLLALQEGTYLSPTKKTLSDFIEDEWSSAVRLTVRPQTAASYESNLKLHVLPSLGQVQLRLLTTPMLNDLYLSLLSEGSRRGGEPKGLSARSVRLVHTILRRALRDAVRWGYLVRNPADGAAVPTPQRKESKTWTAEELASFLRSVRNDRMYPAFVLAATTGMRRGEIVGLRWTDLDMSSGRVMIQQSVTTAGYEVHVGPPKTERSRRAIALDAWTLAILKQWKAKQNEELLALGPDYMAGSFMFSQPDGQMLHPMTLSASFVRRAKRAGLPVIRFHDLRHTWATLALMQGTHPKIVSERLGHSSISITLDVYSHALPAMQTEAAEAIARLLQP